jgi:hypothetical protein
MLAFSQKETSLFSLPVCVPAPPGVFEPWVSRVCPVCVPASPGVFLPVLRSSSVTVPGAAGSLGAGGRPLQSRPWVGRLWGRLRGRHWWVWMADVRFVCLIRVSVCVNTTDATTGATVCPVCVPAPPGVILLKW